MTIPATLTLEAAAARDWDVVVVGAGPAGSLAGRQLAKLGRSVLLVDRATFPRRKVCGCCLNGAALATLARVGLGELPRQGQAVPLRDVRLAAPGQRTRLPLGNGMALSREALDAALVEAAVKAGVAFLPGTSVALRGGDRGSRSLGLRCGVQETLVVGRVVVAADGLGGRLLVGATGQASPAEAGARVGAGTLVEQAPASYSPGTIFLACGRDGYVGLTRVEDGRLDVAAAFDTVAVRQAGGPGLLAARILRDVGWPAVERLEAFPWRGTLPLTRRARRLAGERLFVVGDAAGYVEPFTGEGMAWALAAAVAVAPLAAAPWRPELAGRWAQTHRRVVGRRQRICRVVAQGLRHPGLVRTALALLARWPALAGPLVRHLNTPACNGKGSFA